MAQKQVLLTLNHAPHGSIFYAEGLRAAVGVTAGVDEHSIVVVFLGEGAYAALKGFDRSETARYIGTLADWDYGLKVERESLEVRGISADEVAPDIEIVPRLKVLALLRAADFTIDF